jgi:hypothetical protein
MRRIFLLPAIGAGVISGVGASLLVSAIQSHWHGSAASASGGAPVDHVAQHRAAIRQHGVEQLDREWSKSTAVSLTSSLSGLGKTAGFRVASVDCRTTTCVAYLDWNTYQLSVEHYADILQHDFGIACAREIVLPPPSDPADRYPGDVLFRCQRTESRQSSTAKERVK